MQAQQAEKLRSSIAEVNQLFSREIIAARNFNVIDRIYTADARILPPGMPVVAGREAIGKFLPAFLQSGHVVSAIPATEDVIILEDGAVEMGTTTITVEPPGQASASLRVRYVVLWRLENGAWKIQIDIWNAVE